jgi:hypothetical protein
MDEVLTIFSNNQDLGVSSLLLNAALKHAKKTKLYTIFIPSQEHRKSTRNTHHRHPRRPHWRTPRLRRTRTRTRHSSPLTLHRQTPHRRARTRRRRLFPSLPYRRRFTGGTRSHHLLDLYAGSAIATDPMAHGGVADFGKHVDAKGCGGF